MHKSKNWLTKEGYCKFCGHSKAMHRYLRYFLGKNKKLQGHYLCISKSCRPYRACVILTEFTK